MELEELPLERPPAESSFRRPTFRDLHPRLKAGLDSAQGVLLFLVPSFLVPHSQQSPRPRNLHPTSYLDGLRGVAALFVVLAHYQATFFPYLGVGWHQKEQWADGTEKKNNYLVQFPIIRTFYAARFMVTIFFVISGYVLSSKSLGLARRQEHVLLLKSLASSIFRRFLRLMLPALAASFLCFLLACFNLPTEISKGWDAPDLSEADLYSKPHLLYSPDSVTLLNWIKDAAHLTDPFRFGTVGFPRYDYPLWTMPVEYMGSMIVFIMVIGTSLIRPVLRSLLLAFFVWYCLWNGYWQWCLFIGGVLIADLAYKSPSSEQVSYLPLTEMVDEDECLSNADAEEDLEKSQRLWSWKSASVTVNLATYTSCLKHLSPYLYPAWYIFSTLAFLLAIFLGSFPDGDPGSTATAPGYGWLSQFVPLWSWGLFAGYYFPDLGALLLVFILSKAEFLQSIFTTKVAQYLGDVSLSIYMLHVLVLTTLGNWLIVKCLIMTRGFGSWSFPAGMTIALSCCAVVTFWVGDVFWRLVDIKCIQFAKWVSEKAFVKEK